MKHMHAENKWAYVSFFLLVGWLVGCTITQFVYRVAENYENNINDHALAHVIKKMKHTHYIINCHKFANFQAISIWISLVYTISFLYIYICNKFIMIFESHVILFGHKLCELQPIKGSNWFDSFTCKIPTENSQVVTLLKFAHFKRTTTVYILSL